jgi:hypothetical protein
MAGLLVVCENRLLHLEQIVQWKALLNLTKMTRAVRVTNPFELYHQVNLMRVLAAHDGLGPYTK